MAWLAVDKDGSEYTYKFKPTRGERDFRPIVPSSNYGMKLPKGSIEKTIGRKLTWDDEPVEI